MKIAFLSAEHPPLDKRVFHKEACSLAKAGFSVVHVCPDDGFGSRKVKGVDICVFRRGRGKFWRLLSLVKLYRLGRKSGAQAYHCSEPDSWLVGVALKFRVGAPIVFDCHEYYPGQVVRWLPIGMKRVGAWLTKWGMEVLGLLTNVIVIAKYSLEGEFSWSRSKERVILNAAPAEAIRLSGKTRGDRTDGTFRFVHSGVIRRERGSNELVAALEQLRREGREDIRCVIVGEFKDGSEEEFFARAEGAGVSEFIEFHRWLPVDDAFEVVRRCDAGLILFQRGIANNVRAMPHKLFDYMAAGLPVVGCDFAPDIVRVVEGSRCGVLVDTSRPECLATAMRTLADDKAWAKEMGVRGQRAVLEQYNWETEAEKLVGVYRRLLGPPDGGPRAGQAS